MLHGSLRTRRLADSSAGRRNRLARRLRLADTEPTELAGAPHPQFNLKVSWPVGLTPSNLSVRHGRLSANLKHMPLS